jgi:hypothetical protein
VSEKRVVTSYQVDEDDESEEGAERPKDYRSPRSAGGCTVKRGKRGERYRRLTQASFHLRLCQAGQSIIREKVGGRPDLSFFYDV